MAKLGLPDENFWNQKQPGDLPKATLAQPFGDTGQRMALGNWMTGRQADTTFPSAVKTIPERDLPMYNMRFDGQKPIDLGAGYMENKTQNKAQQANTQQPNAPQLPNINYQGNGQMRVGGIGGDANNFVQSSNTAGMSRVYNGLAQHGINAPQPPAQSAEAQAAGTTDFWLNHNKADQVKADIANKQNSQNQQAQIQNLMNLALTSPNGSMSPTQWNATARQQKAAQMMLGQMLGANQAQQALQAHMADNAANREVGLAGAKVQGQKNWRDYQLAMDNLKLEQQKANQDQWMPVTLKDYQDGMVSGERIVPFNKRNPSQTLGGGMSQPQASANQAPPEALAMLKQNPNLIDQFQAKYGYRPEGF